MSTDIAQPKLIRITTVPQSLRSLLKGQLHYMTKQGFEVIGISSPGEILDEVAEQENIQTIGVVMTRTISPLKDISAVWKLYKIFRKEKPQIVHTHTPKAGTVGMLAAKLARVPHRLHTVAGMPLLVTKGKKRKLLDFVEKKTYSWATMVYPNSNGLKNIIQNNKYTTQNKLKVIGKGSSNGIDTEEFNPVLVTEKTKATLKKSLGIREKDFVFLFVGRLVTDKGVNELVAAFEQLFTSYKDIHLVLVGKFENHLDPLLLKTTISIEQHPQIHAVGYKTNVIDYFAFADVLTFPSYREGFPNVVMQAAAMQLNTIVSDINGCNEIITDAENGWIISVKNTDQLKNKMEWCYLNRDKSKTMGIKSRNLMQEKYERKKIWKLIKDEYHSVINKNNV